MIYLKKTFYLILLFTACAVGCNQSKTETETSISENSTSEENPLDSVSTSDLEQALKRSQPEAATDISDDEMAEFADIYYQITILADSAEGKMRTAISDAGMEMNRFNEIAESQQNGSPGELSDNEKAQLGKISQSFQQIQLKQQDDAMKVLEESGFGMERYQSVMMAIQQSEDLQQQLIQLIETKIETH